MLDTLLVLLETLFTPNPIVLYLIGHHSLQLGTILVTLPHFLLPLIYKTWMHSTTTLLPLNSRRDGEVNGIGTKVSQNSASYATDVLYNHSNVFLTFGFHAWRTIRRCPQNNLQLQQLFPHSSQSSILEQLFEMDLRDGRSSSRWGIDLEIMVAEDAD